MKTILQLADLLIDRIVSGKETPSPEFGLLWVYFPKSQCFRSKVANKKAIWVALKVDELVKYGPTKIVFDAKTAKIRSHPTSSPKWTNLDLTDTDYKVLEKDCQIKLIVPCPEAIILPLPANFCQTHVNNTVWVDPIYGNDRTGQVENSCFPYQSINAAVQAIPSSELEFGKVGWLVNLAPGKYEETVTIPSNVHLKGAGLDQTFLIQLRIIGYGASTVSDLTIQSSFLPLLSVNYTDPNVLINQPISLTNLRLNSLLLFLFENQTVNLIELFQSRGQRGNINLRNVNSNLDLSEFVFSNTQFNTLSINDFTSSDNLNFEVKLNECFSSNIGPMSSINNSNLNLIFVSKSRLFIEGGLYGLTSSALPKLSQTIIQSLDGQVTQTNSNIRVAGTENIIEVIPRYLLYFAINSTIRGSSVTVDYVDTPPELQALAQSSTNSKIILLNLNFISSTLPINLGDLSSIKYSGHDSEGGLISNGKIATRTQKWSTNPVIDPSSSQVYVDVGVSDPIPLPDLTDINTQQIFEGAQQSVSNTTLQPLTLTGPIYGTDGTYVLEPLTTITYQAVGSNYHILSSVSVPFALNTLYNIGNTTILPSQIPAGTTSIEFEIGGGVGGFSGGGVTGGQGGIASASFNWTDGSTDTYSSVLGGAGGNASGLIGGAGGLNGGGTGGNGTTVNVPGYAGGGGGGSTDIRLNGSDLSDRVLIAAGGGGGMSFSLAPAIGGNAGFPNGQDGAPFSPQFPNGGGGGGTQTQGGTGGSPNGEDGSLLQGGNGVNAVGLEGIGGGGGGAGLYGGGGGEAGSGGGAGGGGSNYAGPSAINPSFDLNTAPPYAVVKFVGN